MEGRRRGKRSEVSWWRRRGERSEVSWWGGGEGRGVKSVGGEKERVPHIT